MLVITSCLLDQLRVSGRTMIRLLPYKIFRDQY